MTVWKVVEMSKESENKQKILIVDDSEMNRWILTDMLMDEYEILEASNGVEAVAMIQKLGTDISLVLLDIVMPEMDGFEVLRIMNKYRWIEDIPVITISAESTPDFMERAYEAGVTDYISRPFDAMVVRRRVINTIMLYAKQKRLIGLVTDQIIEREKSNGLMVSILSHIVESRNGESGLHVLHIRTITEILLRQLMKKTDKYHLSKSDISLISMASSLHDVGKISIPSEVLNKPGRLTKEEFEIMKTHSEIGSAMLKEIPQYQNAPLVRVAYEICRWHHERYDGRGYPDGLKGEEIPISAQIVSIADVYDALTSERVYKKAFTHEIAMQMILNGECGVFNPLLLECLMESSDAVQYELKQDAASQSSEKEIKKIAEEMMQHEDLTTSERNLRVLEHERIKYDFLMEISNELQFEYTVVPPMVVLSEWGAKQLGISRVIMDPMEGGRISGVMSESQMEELRSLIRRSTPEEPVVRYECDLRVGDERKKVQLVCRSLWSVDQPPVYTGVIGKALALS